MNRTSKWPHPNTSLLPATTIAPNPHILALNMHISLIISRLAETFAPASSGAVYHPCSTVQPPTAQWPSQKYQRPVPLKMPRPHFGRFSPTYWRICDEASKSPVSRSPIGSEVAAARRDRQTQNLVVAQHPPSHVVVAKPAMGSGYSHNYNTKDIHEIAVGQPRCFFPPPAAHKKIEPAPVPTLVPAKLQARCVAEASRSTRTTVNQRVATEVQHHTHPSAVTKKERTKYPRYVPSMRSFTPLI